MNASEVINAVYRAQMDHHKRHILHHSMHRFRYLRFVQVDAGEGVTAKGEPCRIIITVECDEETGAALWPVVTLK